MLWRGTSQCASKSIASVGCRIIGNVTSVIGSITNIIGSVTNVRAALLAERTAIGRVRKRLLTPRLEQTVDIKWSSG